MNIDNLIDLFIVTKTVCKIIGYILLVILDFAATISLTKFLLKKSESKLNNN